MKKSQSMSHFLHHANIILENALKNDDIIERVSAFGYTKEKLNEGKELYENVRAKQELKKEKALDLSEALRKAKALYEKTKKRYYRDLKIARIIFTDDNGTLDKLEARGSRKNAMGGWISQAKTFYHNAVSSPQTLAKLSTMNLTEEVLKEGRAIVEELEEARAEKEARTGEARNATKDRDETFKQLKKWIAAFKTIVFIVFDEDPADRQEPERMGWVVKNE